MTVISFDFIVNEFNKCVYYKIEANDYVVLFLYVDDILLFDNNLEIVNETKSFLSKKFKMKDMGEANVILGLRLTRLAEGITISQSHYIEKVLEKFGYQNCKVACTSYDLARIFYKNKSGVPVSQLQYS